MRQAAERAESVIMQATGSDGAFAADGRPVKPTCGCCEKGTLKTLLTQHPDRYGRLVDVLQCQRCHALQGYYRPWEATAGLDQAVLHARIWSNESAPAMLKARDAMKNVIRFYAHLLPRTSEDHLIWDIGSGRGNLIAALVDEGFNARGCEPSIDLVSRARSVYGLSDSQLAHSGAHAFLDAQHTEGRPADAVFLWHVLEHLPQPLSLLALLKAQLKPGGVLICQGPLLSSENLFPAHRFIHAKGNVEWIAKKVGLTPAFVDFAVADNFISFVLQRPLDERRRKSREDRSDSASAVGEPVDNHPLRQ